MIVDLHTHTKYSDGELGPAELVEFVKGYGVTVVAITDHDTIGGVKEAVEAGIQHEVTVLAGVELTTYHNDCELHMLGINIDIHNRPLIKELEDLKISRYLRIKRMLAKLRDIGVMIHDRDVFTEGSGIGSQSDIHISYGRPHIARALCEKGYTSSFKEAFDRYIGDSCPSYVEKKKLQTIQGIRLLKQAGGLTVLAHPETRVSEEDLDFFVENGLDGIEVYSAAHDEMLAYHYEIVAQQRNLFQTAGSDLHGSKGYHVKIERLNMGDKIFEGLKKAIPGKF